MARSKSARALNALGEIDLALSSAYVKRRTEGRSVMALVDLKNRRGRSAADLLLSKDPGDQAEAQSLVREHLNFVARKDLSSMAST